MQAVSRLSFAVGPHGEGHICCRSKLTGLIFKREYKLIKIKGVRRPGGGCATGNLAIQLPEIAKEFPEIAQCHLGTINLELEYPLLVITPDHRTQPIRWLGSTSQGEIFDLLRIKIEAPTGAEPEAAWLYIAHWSYHRPNPKVHEVIARKLDILEDAQCQIIIDRQSIDLPYSQWQAKLII